MQPHGGLPPMWLGDFETAQQAQSAVTTSFAGPATHLLRFASPLSRSLRSIGTA
ncbi:hypothetical protein [Schleiferilactobacillus harbinensis]|uniref:hypothetical protein n=1 Tax=Schleiferilactobacillus harbinensis TaxID=304207 RepID=UPI0039EC327C